MSAQLWCGKCIKIALNRGTTKRDIAFYIGGTGKNETQLYAGANKPFINLAVSVVDGNAVCGEHL